jgi:hypothetical protein
MRTMPQPSSSTSELSSVDPHTSVAPVANGPPLSSDAATIEAIGRRVSAKNGAISP